MSQRVYSAIVLIWIKFVKRTTAVKSLGEIVRHARTRYGLTIEELSLRCGIASSTLSKVERGERTLKYDQLRDLSTRLGIRMSDLLLEYDADAPIRIIGLKSIGTIQNAFRVKAAKYDHYQLCSDIKHRRMVPYLTRVRAVGLNDTCDLDRHSGEEFVFVVKGRIVVHTELYHPAELSEGQAIYLDAEMGHAYVLAESCDEAFVIAVTASRNGRRAAHESLI